MLLIPREGGYLVRSTSTSARSTPRTRAGPRYQVERLIERRSASGARTIEVRKSHGLRSTKSGSGFADKFDDVPAAEMASVRPRVHCRRRLPHASAKAGQGMNVSMQDGFNLGWKLAAVLEAQARPSCCTPTRPSVTRSRRT